MATPIIPTTSDMFLGKTKKQSQDFAETKNMIFQLVRIDGEQYFSYPKDDEPIRTDRVWVEIENSKVVKAVIR